MSHWLFSNYVKHFLIYVNFSIIEGGMQGSDN